jgi:hypothetical protein
VTMTRARSYRTDQKLPEASTISTYIQEKFQIVSSHAFWDQKELSDEKTGGEKSRGPLPLKTLTGVDS